MRLCAEAGDGRLRIEVHDDGIGIPPEFLPFVFDRFRQRDSSTTRVHGGLGLGLAIVRHLVEAHGGTVTAESAGDGKGATFRVELPMPPVDLAAPAAATTPTDGARRGALAGLRVLLVEDEPDSADLFRRVLEGQGATVELSADATRAYEAMTEAPPDVLVADIGLPGEDGYSLLRRVRALPADLGGAVPAAALTAYAGPAHAELARQAGYALHLPKPVTPDELVSAVASLARKDSVPAH